MNSDLQKLSRGYVASLRKYLANQHEAVLEQAYELGRTAIGKGLGVLDMARVHQESLKKVFPAAAAMKDGQVFGAAGTFLWESLSPFEATLRGFREMNIKLQERNRELEEEISQRKRMEENLRGLSDKILRTQEEERKRISRELHDEVGQSLTAISVTLASLNDAGAKSASAGKRFADTQNLLQGTMEKVHRFARDLRPSMLDELGLLPALRSYLKAYALRTGLRVSLNGHPDAEQLKDEQKTVLYRIAQESLTNITKHAHAKEVVVTLKKLDDGICMEVADNGRSFNTAARGAAKSKGRLGLLGMQERVRLVNGQFDIAAKPGKGTTIRVVIPFNSTPSPKQTSQH